MWYHFSQFNPGGSDRKTSGESLLASKERSSATVLSVWPLSHLRTMRGGGLRIKPCTLGKGEGKPRDSAQDAENRISQSWRQKALVPCVYVKMSLLGIQQGLCSEEPPSSLWLSVCNSNRHAEYSFPFWFLNTIICCRIAATAKSLQSCPTLCDPIDSCPPGSPVPGILQARTLEWVAISFSNAWKWKVKVKLLSRVQLFVTP